LVRVQRNLSSKDFEAFLKRNSLQNTRTYDPAQLLVLKFDAKSIDSLEKTIERLRKDSVVESAEPNYLMSIQ
jgi:hypothetical protein